ncbi:MAG: ParB/RepB/Spo0J family partition protein [bacterium]|nr:ParB/RepB/Spo0J family partition protein [bacterium]
MEQKKKALGRGLEQLFGNDGLDFDAFETNIVESATEKDIKEIKLSEVMSNPYQPRKNFDMDALNELAESIKSYGVFQPIIVKKNVKGYYIVAGERRVKASKLAGLTTIPAIVRDFTDDEMREIALLENIQRENLSSIELAWAYKGIIDSLHIRQEDLAVKLGKSRSHVTNTLGLLRLPDKVQNMVLGNELSMGHARVLSKIDEDKKIEEMAKLVIDNNLSVRELERISTSEDVKKKIPMPRKEKSNEYSYLENSLSETLGTKVRINNKKMLIYFENNADLNRILDIMKMGY